MRCILKTTGFLILLGVSIYLSISLSAQLALPKGRFPLVEMAETEGWCTSSSVTYELHVFNETPFVLFEDPEVGAPLHTDICCGTKGGYWANYPEVTPYFLVAIEDDGTNKKLFTGGNNGNKKIRFRIKEGLVPKNLSKSIPPYAIVNLSKNGLRLSDVGIDEAIEYELTEVGNLNWRGLYYALGFDDNTPGDSINSFKWALANTNTSTGKDKPNNDLEIVFDKANPFQVVAIKTWNHNSTYSKLPIDFENFVQDQETDLELGSFDIAFSLDALKVALNIDNVNFVREEIQRYIYLEDGSLEDFIPESGEHIDDRVAGLGRLVVAGIIVNPLTGEGRPYDEIIEILVDMALGRTANFITGDLPSGGGIDWLQVAAADIYNADVNNEVFQCVWEIHSRIPPRTPTEPSEDGPEPFGAVKGTAPYLVYLNPFNPKMRFNKKSEAYSFHCNKTRDTVVWHEALHAYTHLPGKLVNDEEIANYKLGDQLFVKQGGGKTPYHTFSYDDKSRGFLEADPYLNIGPYFGINKVKALLHGRYGDNYFFHGSDGGRLIVRIDDKLTEDDLKQLFLDNDHIVPDPFIDFGFPEDLPLTATPTRWIEQEGIYLSLEPGIDFKIDYLLATQKAHPLRVESDYGYYDSHSRVIDFISSWMKGEDYPEPWICFELLKRGKAKLYVIYKIVYYDCPEEYDAAYFSAISRGMRS